jgi:hypothetical protein
MPEAFNPVEELRRHGLLDDSLSAEAEQAISMLTSEQVGAFIEVKRRVEALQEPGVQDQPVEDGSLALAMTRTMGWDRPSMAAVGAEVEGMESACACLCTGGGGGGGA